MLDATLLYINHHNPFELKRLLDKPWHTHLNTLHLRKQTISTKHWTHISHTSLVVGQHSGCPTHPPNHRSVLARHFSALRSIFEATRSFKFPPCLPPPPGRSPAGPSRGSQTFGRCVPVPNMGIRHHKPYSITLDQGHDMRNIQLNGSPACSFYG